jgi:hypothetical protein
VIALRVRARWIKRATRVYAAALFRPAPRLREGHEAR